jgi:hypothetical protein
VLCIKYFGKETKNKKNINMQTYTLITVEESTINLMGRSGMTYKIPVDNNGNTVTDYLSKNRVIYNDNQMIVFDTEQEYVDWLQQNT